MNNWERKEEKLQMQLHEILKRRRRYGVPFAALTANKGVSYFNAQAQKLLKAEYIKWLRQGERVFVMPAVKDDENSYHIRKFGNIFIPPEARKLIGNGVYHLVECGEVFELKKHR